MICRNTLLACGYMCLEAYKEFPPGPFNGEADGINYGTDNIYIVRKLGQTFIVCLGTEFSIAEWLMNFKFLKKNIKYLGRIHRGFHRNLRELWDLLQDTGVLNEPNLIFTGHSRGAAIASLLAVSYAKLYNREPKLVTFGSPRVGNKKWLSTFNESGVEGIRVAINSDPVTKIPMINYCHVGEPLEIEGGGHNMHYYLEALRR